MKIAVASNDGVSVSQHFGRTSQFSIYEVEHDEIQAEELRDNIGTVGDEGDCEAHHAYQNRVHDYGQMIAALEDCRVVLCRGMGVRAAVALVRRGINPLVIAGDMSPRQAAEQYIAGTLQPASGFCRCQK
ncbi:MAG: NifB/NifX family molybdenum-iron cluster-binding protein [Pirellulaceae bacterium]